ncbi:hypothetical protein BDW68DRAFT_177913 [Aspergillus falconensis]
MDGAPLLDPSQAIDWGLAEVLQSQVTNASGWYAARLFLGPAESGLIPAGLYTLSRWYAPDELTKRTAAFFGPSVYHIWVVDVGRCFGSAWAGRLERMAVVS